MDREAREAEWLQLGRLPPQRRQWANYGYQGDGPEEQFMPVFDHLSLPGFSVRIASLVFGRGMAVRCFSGEDLTSPSSLPSGVVPC